MLLIGSFESLEAAAVQFKIDLAKETNEVLYDEAHFLVRFWNVETKVRENGVSAVYVFSLSIIFVCSCRSKKGCAPKILMTRRDRGDSIDSIDSNGGTLCKVHTCHIHRNNTPVQSLTWHQQAARFHVLCLTVCIKWQQRTSGKFTTGEKQTEDAMDIIHCYQ